MNRSIPAIVIGGTGSGAGKTSLALGLTRALTRQGCRVQPFKVGPDFLDPTYLSRAAHRVCYNLDAWMTSPDYVRTLFARASADAEFAIVEGVMGLFDGASPESLRGSTAEIAALLNAPVLLVAGAHGVGRSFAATVKGFAQFEPGLRLAGVVANHSGSERHRALLSTALESANLPPLLGAVPRDAFPTLPSRHLGLVAADDRVASDDILDQLADACERHVDLARLRKITAGRLGAQRSTAQACDRHPTVARIGVAFDEAFSFYYPDALEALEQAGAELVRFSPLRDRRLPAELDGIYLGGGYPELHADALAANRSMREEVAEFAASGRAVYAECGGLVYLGRALELTEGRRLPMANVLPVVTQMLSRRQSLGYVEVSLRHDALWGRRGQALRGHEFHYSRIVEDDSESAGWREVYDARFRRNNSAAGQGYQRGRVLASYIHLNLAAQRWAARSFVDNCTRETCK
ncbi:MAG: cobyrinate a,c-diamide synthase [Planctomycetota bacterium]